MTIINADKQYTQREREHVDGAQNTERSKTPFCFCVPVRSFMGMQYRVDRSGGIFVVC